MSGTPGKNKGSKLTLGVIDEVHSTWQVVLKGGPAHNRLMQVPDRFGPDLLVPVARCLNDWVKAGPLPPGPIDVAFETHRYSPDTGEYLGSNTQESTPPADKSAQPSGGAMASVNQMIPGGKARIVLEDGQSIDGYVATMDSRVDTYDTYAFGKGSKSYVAGLPRCTLTFEVTGAWQYELPTTTIPTKALSNKKEIKFMQLFEYAVVYEPRDDDGKVIQKDVKVLTEITSTLARSHEAVQKKAIQEIAAATADLDLDFVRVISRPFGY